MVGVRVKSDTEVTTSRFPAVCMLVCNYAGQCLLNMCGPAGLLLLKGVTKHASGAWCIETRNQPPNGLYHPVRPHTELWPYQGAWPYQDLLTLPGWESGAQQCNIVTTVCQGTSQLIRSWPLWSTS